MYAVLGPWAARHGVFVFPGMITLSAPVSRLLGLLGRSEYSKWNIYTAAGIPGRLGRWEKVTFCNHLLPNELFCNFSRFFIRVKPSQKSENLYMTLIVARVVKNFENPNGSHSR
jgi:hypothetical protein